MEVVVGRLHSVRIDTLVPLAAQSERDGWRFVRRLADEWVAGTCRFDRTGCGPPAARVNAIIVGVCNLNVDPCAADPTIGRVRRLHVLQA
jgi:hypothetical protein